MKKLIVYIVFSFLALALVAGVVDAKTKVGGYYRKNGTYVKPYYRTSPNRTKFDNWSTKGNRNPYTGKYGTKRLY